MIVTWTGGYLLYLGRPGLDQEVEGGGDEGEADVLDNLGLLGGHRDGPLLQVDLPENITVTPSPAELGLSSP